MGPPLPAGSIVDLGLWRRPSRIREVCRTAVGADPSEDLPSGILVKRLPAGQDCAARLRSCQGRGDGHVDDWRQRERSWLHATLRASRTDPRQWDRRAKRFVCVGGDHLSPGHPARAGGCLDTRGRDRRRPRGSVAARQRDRSRRAGRHRSRPASGHGSQRRRLFRLRIGHAIGAAPVQGGAAASRV
jgi:hypothetical protein